MHAGKAIGITVITASLALAAGVGTASAQNAVCAGIAGCVVAPAIPVVVAVTSEPTTFEVDCPVGLTPARHAASTQPGVLATNVPLPSDEVDPFSASAYTPGVVATVPASPTVSATSTAGDAIVAGNSASRPSFYEAAVDDAMGVTAAVYGLTVQGDTSTNGASGSAPVPAPVGSLFTASVPPTPTSASGKIPEQIIYAADEQWNVSLTGAWTWLTPATMTPSIGCAPVAAPRKQVTHHRISGNRSVRAGRASHWLRCPAGKVRVGNLKHAVYVEGRSRLTRPERLAIDSRVVASASGGQHVETRLGDGAPSGVRVQLHATCRG